MVDADGDIRDHWSGLATAYRALGVGRVARRRDEIQTSARAGRRTYNVLRATAAHRQSGAWTLDPVPFIVPERASGRSSSAA